MQGPNKACGFIGPFDAVMREEVNPRMADGINDLIKEASKRGIAMGRVVGSGSMEDPKDIEDAMVNDISACYGNKRWSSQLAVSC